MPLHPAEHRGYRELILSANEAQTRLSRLAEHLAEEQRQLVQKAALALDDMVGELKPALAKAGLPAELAAGGGARIGTVRAAILDRFLERNQALRFAVDDLEHVTTLLAYLAAVSETRRAKALPELCRAWERRLRRQVGIVRKAAVDMASDPDEAIEPLDPSPVGKVAHGAALAAGSAGEAIDRTAASARKAAPARRGIFRRKDRT